jgi:hypothetical protein
MNEIMTTVQVFSTSFVPRPFLQGSGAIENERAEKHCLYSSAKQANFDKRRRMKAQRFVINRKKRLDRRDPGAHLTFWQPYGY